MGRPQSAAWPIWPVLLSLAVPSIVVACPVQVPDGLLDRVFDVQYTDVPDVRLATAWGTAYVELGRCNGYIDVDTVPQFAGLQYVRHIGGAPAYAFAGAPGAPLVTMELDAYAPQDEPDEEGVGHNTFISAHASSSFRMWVPGPNMQMRLNIALYSPGGPVRGIASTDLGSFTHTVRQQPGSQLRQRLQLGVNVQGPTCTLSDTSVTLDPVSADALRAGGSTAGAKPFDVLMNCPFAGTPVKLTLTDVNQPGNRTTGLLPAPGSTSGGVRVQLRRGGTPITIGQQWDHGVSEAGTNRIALEARYLRTTGTLRPGELTVQGVLTADYR
ncbi:fimbrial protein [Stenotrophomonas maltophilia]|uniref:fimbrial protein n=1 Tax=Stenotrophomonas maltophilia TaxID=40324 RepID=UPI0021B14F6D|nr:fimbrial protein [Stenotrophomonas maltophilia]